VDPRKKKVTSGKKKKRKPDTGKREKVHRRVAFLFNLKSNSVLIDLRILNLD
jgi:hypothetical protein